MTARDQVFFFGSFRLDVAARELRRDGTPVELQPRVFDLLAYLVAHRERAVDKNEIQDAVWRRRIVTETALTRAIMKARRAVGDSAEAQALIRTVHGHGYQFVADVTVAPPATASGHAGAGVAQPQSPDTRTSDTTSDPPDADTALAASAHHATRTPRRGVAVLAVIVATVVGLAYWFWPNAPRDGAVRIAVAPVVNATGDDDFGWASLGLMGVANDLLRNAAKLEIVAPADVVRYADTAGWPRSLDAPGHADHVATLARQFGATHVLVSELSHNAGALRLSYRVMDRDGQMNDGTMVGARGIELVKGMVRSIGTRLTSQRHFGDRALSVTGDPFVDEAYARGMSLSLAGRCAEAMPHFNVVTDAVGDLIGVRLERANCALILGRWQEAQAEFEGVLAGLEANGPPDSVRAEAFAGLASVHHRTGRVESAGELYQRGLDEAQAVGDRSIGGNILIGLAILAKDRHDFDVAQDLLARASLAYRDAGREPPGALHGTQANIAMNDGRLDQAEGYLDAALASYRAAGDRRREALILNNYGYLRRTQGRLSEAEPLHRQSLAIREDIGDRVGQGRIHGMLSVLYETQGDYEQALTSADAAIAIAKEARDALFTGTGLSQRGAAELGLGRLDDALASFSEAEQVFLSINDRSRAWQVQVRLAAIDLAAGRPDAAEERASELIAPASEAGLFEAVIEAREVLGDVAVARDRTDIAIEHYRRALTEQADTGFATSRRQALRLKLAELHLDNDDVTAAEPLIGRALDGEPSLELSRLHARLAFVLGERTRAFEILDGARATAGARWTADDEATLARYASAVASVDD